MKNREQSFEETSIKKYPYNKYFQYKDEDQSLRKNLDYAEPASSYRGVPMYDDEDDKENLPLKSNQVPHHIINKKHNDTFVEFSSYCTKKSKNLKNKKSSSCNPSVSQTIASNRPRKSTQKSKQSTSKMEDSKKKSRSRIHQSTNEGEELKYYKKICLQMRKKNCMLNGELRECKEKNKESLIKLQKKVDRINDGYIKERKTEIDTSRMEKIFESLRTINGKLNKQTNVSTQQNLKYKKFYEFFIESLGVLEPNEKGNGKKNMVEVQLIWKQILQFLIMHDFKMDDALRGNYTKKH